jgi:hypothetical protein
MRLSRIDPLRDAITSGGLGAQTPDRQPTSSSPHEGGGAVVSHQSPRAPALPVSAALPEGAGACAVRWHAGQLPPAGGGAPRCGAGVAVLAGPTQQQEGDGLGEMPATAADVSPAHTQERPQYLTGRAGQHSDAPEECRDAGSRGTGCVHCSRPGLWGGRVGNHRLYPEADALQRPLVPRFRFRARLTASVRRRRRRGKNHKSSTRQEVVFSLLVLGAFERTSCAMIIAGSHWTRGRRKQSSGHSTPDVSQAFSVSLSMELTTCLKKSGHARGARSRHPMWRSRTAG